MNLRLETFSQPLHNQGNKLSGQMRKMALCLTPQAI